MLKSIPLIRVAKPEFFTDQYGFIVDYLADSPDVADLYSGRVVYRVADEHLSPRPHLAAGYLRELVLRPDVKRLGLNVLLAQAVGHDGLSYSVHCTCGLGPGLCDRLTGRLHPYGQ